MIIWVSCECKAKFYVVWSGAVKAYKPSFLTHQQLSGHTLHSHSNHCPTPAPHTHPTSTICCWPWSQHLDFRKKTNAWRHASAICLHIMSVVPRKHFRRSVYPNVRLICMQNLTILQTPNSQGNEMMGLLSSFVKCTFSAHPPSLRHRPSPLFLAQKARRVTLHQRSLQMSGLPCCHSTSHCTLLNLCVLKYSKQPC